MSKGVCKAEIFETFHIVPMAVKRILKKFKHSGTHFHKKKRTVPSVYQRRFVSVGTVPTVLR